MAKVVSKKNSENIQEVRVIVELKMPEQWSKLTPVNLRINRFLEEARAFETSAAASISVTPVKDVHIVEIDVSSTILVQDTDVSASQVFTATKQISTSRPVSVFIHITGEANTMIEVECKLAGVSEFKGNLFIPNSGRLVIQKIIA